MLKAAPNFMIQAERAAVGGLLGDFEIHGTVTGRFRLAVAMERFGKDHWSMLAYLETRAVDHGGFVSHRHFRRNLNTHPQIPGTGVSWLPSYGTQLKGGEVLPTHDDWDVIQDLQASGIVHAFGDAGDAFGRAAWAGHVTLTSYGTFLAAKLRAHKTAGGTFGTFVP